MKKGFTLIELLAVIVILAIIAVIAVPIVLNIINETKESATLRSADFYVGALENEIALQNMKLGGTLNPSRCVIRKDGNAKCDGVLLNVEGKTYLVCLFISRAIELLCLHKLLAISLMVRPSFKHSSIYILTSNVIWELWGFLFIIIKSFLINF